MRTLKSFAALVAIVSIAIGCGGKSGSDAPAAAAPASKPILDLGPIAEQYVKLGLAMGVHDEIFVDAYYGPAEWKTAAETAKKPIETIRTEAQALLQTLQNGVGADADQERRRQFLIGQLGALDTRIDLFTGKKLRFVEEASRLYGMEPSKHDTQHFDGILKQLDRALPGEGPIYDRLETLRSRLVIPPKKVAKVFEAALAECRDQTLKFIQLPEGESFQIEYVTGKPWAGYNWYKGDYHSVIQINTDLPIPIDRAVDIACHEAYPGHHVLNVLIERDLVKGKGWVEHSIYPLFSPQSLIAEGTAVYGVPMIFPGDSRFYFEQEKLYPVAGLDASLAETYFNVARLLENLSYATNEAARGYLDGELDAAAAATFLQTYELMTPERAAQRIQFIDRYRSYVINYNVGHDLVTRWVEAAGPEDARRKRFINLLSTPFLVSELKK